MRAMLTADPPQALPTPAEIRKLWDEAGLETPGLPDFEQTDAAEPVNVAGDRSDDRQADGAERHLGQ
jgi:hypothetical protein